MIMDTLPCTCGPTVHWHDRRLSDPRCGVFGDFSQPSLDGRYGVLDVCNGAPDAWLRTVVSRNWVARRETMDLGIPRYTLLGGIHACLQPEARGTRIYHDRRRTGQDMMPVVP